MFVSKLEELECELELEEELLEDDEGVVLATGEGALELPPPPPQAERKSTRRKENILINLIEI